MGSVTLSAALEYAERGWRVLPITPGTKYPPLEQWQTKATTDETVITEWFTNKFRSYGIGIATGSTDTGETLFVIDIDTAGRKTGDESFADLQATYEKLPDTWEVITGTGGRHLYFVTDAVITNSANSLGTHIDIRGEGGQVLAPPTQHPTTGRHYELEASNPPQPATAPDWLTDLLTTTEEQQPRTHTPPYKGPPRPGDVLAANVAWPELLQADGAKYVGKRAAAQLENQPVYELWSRPGLEDNDRHTSATLYYGGSDVLKVHTPNWTVTNKRTGEQCTLKEGATYTRFGYWAQTRHNGDQRAAAAALANEYGMTDDILPALNDTTTTADIIEETPEPAENTNTWELVDIQPHLDGTYTMPVPGVLTRSDGKGLFYAGRVNSIQGESGHGKSWVAMLACAEAVTAGRTAIYIDWEDHPANVIGRMLMLGVAPDALAANFKYVSPDGPATTHTVSWLESLAHDCDPQVVVIDSVGESMGSQGTDQNADNQVTQWFNAIPRPLATNSAAVIIVDHVVKDTERRGLWASGSQRKRAAVDGAAYMVEADPPPAKGVAGTLKLRTAKDRNGTYQTNTIAANIEVDATDGTTVAMTVDAPTHKQQDTRPLTVMKAVSWQLEQTAQGMNKRTLRDAVKGRNADIEEALQQLLNAGYISREQGDNNAVIHKHIACFDPDDEVLGDYISRCAQCAQSVPKHTRHTALQLAGEVPDVGLVPVGHDPTGHTQTGSDQSAKKSEKTLSVPNYNDPGIF